MIYGHRKQFEKTGFNTKKETQDAERKLLSLDKVSYFKNYGIIINNIYL